MVMSNKLLPLYKRLSPVISFVKDLLRPWKGKSIAFGLAPIPFLGLNRLRIENFNAALTFTLALSD
jgi:hypothetical protein